MYLSLNTRYNPFTYDELVKPLMDYKKAYDEVENAYSTLSEQAEAIKHGIDPESNAYITHSKYLADLNAAIDDFSKGMTGKNRSQLLGLKRRYNTEIIPIKNAYAWKLQQIQNQLEGRSKGMVYEGDAATTSLDEYLKNPNLIYGFADSNAGYTRIANAAQALARGLSDAQITGNLDEYTKKLLISSGYNVQDVSTSVTQALSDLQNVLSGKANMQSSAGQIIQSLLNNEAKASGISAWEDNKAKQEYISKVSPALYNLVGQTKVSLIDDYYARENLQYNNRVNLQNNAAQIAKDAAAEQHKQAMELAALKAGKGRTGTQYEYDRSDKGYSGGAAYNVITEDSGAIKVMSEDGIPKDIVKTEPVTVKLNPKNTNDVQIWAKGKLIASYNVGTDGKKDGVLHRHGDTNRAAHGDAQFDTGMLKGLTTEDVRNLARAVVSNPGSENQYNYEIATDKDGNTYLLSTQNKAQRVTSQPSYGDAGLLLNLLQEAGY